MPPPPSDRTLDWLNIAVLLGAAQGVFLTVVLATQRRNRTANRLLAALMLSFSILMISNLYLAAGLEQRFPHFFGLGYPMPLLFGPLFYLYAVSASDRTRRLRWSDGLHFLPFAAVVIGSLPIYLLSAPDKIEFYHRVLRGARTPVMQVADPLKYMSGIAYTAVTLLFLRRHHAKVKDNYSSIDRVNLQWLIRLGVASAAIWVLATVTSVLGPFQRADDVVMLAIAITVYGIGYMGLRQPEIFNFAARDYRVTHPAPEPVPSPAAEAPGARYERSGLTEREADTLKHALLATMDSASPYKNRDLTLADLAEQLETTPHKLSEVLNSQLEQSFYDFVNGYRVRYVQRRIASDEARNLKLLSLALDAGFASKSTFNDVFKKYTGKTPSDYRRSVAA